MRALCLGERTCQGQWNKSTPPIYYHYYTWFEQRKFYRLFAITVYKVKWRQLWSPSTCPLMKRHVNLIFQPNTTMYMMRTSLLLLYSSWQKRPTQQIFLQDWQEGKEKYWKYSTHRKTVYREKKQSHFFRWDKTPRIKRIKGPALTEKQVVIWLQLEKR